LQYGFEDTMTRIIFPFLMRIGMLWQTGVVNPAQEHFVSNLIRQKLVLAIDGIIEKDKPDAKQFLLFLPEGELHEIGLLFYSYLIKKNGHKIIYLGQSVPLTDIENIINTKDCDYFITSFASNISGLDVYEYLHKLSLTCKDKEIVFSCFEEGIKENQKLPPNVKRIKDALHFKEMLMKIEQE
jgi:MerR family transcriptional regulator, light-induced transcriptional regulator